MIERFAEFIKEQESRQANENKDKSVDPAGEDCKIGEAIDVLHVVLVEARSCGQMAVVY
jgi:hypothetical protein